MAKQDFEYKEGKYYYGDNQSGNVHPDLLRKSANPHWVKCLNESCEKFQRIYMSGFVKPRCNVCKSRKDQEILKELPEHLRFSKL